MYQQETKITALNGLHTRPAVKLIKEAKNLRSKITIIANGKKASIKSLFELQSLGLKKGTIITISAEGENEKESVKYLIEFFKKLK